MYKEYGNLNRKEVNGCYFGTWYLRSKSSSELLFFEDVIGSIHHNPCGGGNELIMIRSNRSLGIVIMCCI